MYIILHIAGLQCPSELISAGMLNTSPLEIGLTAENHIHSVINNYHVMEAGFHHIVHHILHVHDDL